MVFGPGEAFTPEHLAELYGINVLSTQRVNRVALPPTAQALEGSIIPVVGGHVSGRRREARDGIWH
jgi:hypothetical protein